MQRDRYVEETKVVEEADEPFHTSWSRVSTVFLDACVDYRLKEALEITARLEGPWEICGH